MTYADMLEKWIKGGRVGPPPAKPREPAPAPVALDSGIWEEMDAWEDSIREKAKAAIEEERERKRWVMQWENLVGRCIFACAQRNIVLAEAIRYDETAAILKAVPADRRNKAEVETLKYLIRMEEALNAFFPQ